MNVIANNEVIKYLSYNISYLRKSNNITKREMAKILSIGIKSLNKIEQGIIPPRLSVEVLFRIRDYFGVPLSIQVSLKIDETTEDF